MKFLFFLILIFSMNFVKSQVEYSQKLLDYFTLRSIENKDFQNQIVFSATCDEIGWNGELYSLKKNFFSFNFQISYKRLLPNMGKLWTPLTFENISILPQNGAMTAFQTRWYFNRRKFSFAGVRIYGGFVWLNNIEMPDYIRPLSQSDRQYLVLSHQGFRYGLDVVAGRKFVNKFFSEISFQAGLRKDHSESVYQCISGCYSSNTNAPQTKNTSRGFMHFQIILAFDIFQK